MQLALELLLRNVQVHLPNAIFQAQIALFWEIYQRQRRNDFKILLPTTVRHHDLHLLDILNQGGVMKIETSKHMDCMTQAAKYLY